MILDCHMHVRDREQNRAEFERRLRKAGVGGGVVISLPPPNYLRWAEGVTHRERLDNVLSWCEGDAECYPFFWLDPMAPDALEQVAMAVERGVAGFKVICHDHYPGDERAMPVYQAVASAGRPILFHSGILWDGEPSSFFNRPAEFEALLDVEGLRFALAHISWPWVDECLAVYGKILVASNHRADLKVEMFIDTTPGTPPIYRRDALTKLYSIGYEVADNVLFGSDSSPNDYDVDSVRQWLERDAQILGELGLSREALDGIHAGNLRRFLGLSARKANKTPPPPGQ